MKKIIKNQNGGTAPTGTQSWFQTYGGNIASNLLDKLPNSGQFLNGNNFEMGQVRDGISNILLSSENPWLMAAGAVYGVGNKLGVFSDASQGLGTWNDIGNATLSLIPGLKYILPKTDKLHFSIGAQALGDQAYAGTKRDMQRDIQNSGIHIGFGTNKQQTRANKFNTQNEKLETIGTGALNDSWAVAFNAQNMALQGKHVKSGGYKKTSLYGKLGMKIERVKQISSQIKEKENIFKPTSAEDDKAFFDSLVFDETPIFQEGGKISKRKYPTFESFMNYLKETGRTDPNYRYEDFYNDENAYFNWESEEEKNPGKAHMLGDYKTPDHMTYSYEGYGWKQDEDGNWTFTTSPEQIEKWDFNKYVDYWNNNEPKSTLIYGDKTYKVGDIKSHKEGGQMNVIPEGSLHARLHHMEGADNLTKKGIPVVDNEGNQHAEVERAELIFNKEVTDKLEELLKKFNSEEHTVKEKDDFAIEAGKLLSTQIIENTDDRAGLINKVENEQIQSNN